MDDTCPQCGRPLERADDFWYCDNPDCPRRPAARDGDEPVPQAEPSARAPAPGRPGTPAPSGR